MHKKGSAFIAMGLLLLAAALLLTGYNIREGNQADKAAQTAAAALKEQISYPTEQQTEPASVSTQPATESPTEAETMTLDKIVLDHPETPEMPTIEIDGYAFIGTLDVESLNLSLPVMEEWDYERLKISPCRFAGNVYSDDMVLCSHNYPHHFNPLKYAPIGTVVRFTDAEGQVFTYEIASIESVGPMDMEKLLYGEWDLTLFTCNTSGQTRCAIRCDRVR